MSDLAPHYSRFRVAERLLLTGHSHQAWPDVGFEGQQRAWLDAAEYVDLKWEKAAEQALHVRAGFAALLGVGPEQIALGQNTHELVTRWLSALPLRARPRLVTTDGEFHTIRRQMDRLAEEALEVVKVAAAPCETLAERLGRAVDNRTAGVLVSSVLYETAEIVPGLDRLADACQGAGAGLLVDAYHHLNVVPFDVAAARLLRRLLPLEIDVLRGVEPGALLGLEPDVRPRLVRMAGQQQPLPDAEFGVMTGQVSHGSGL